MGGGNILKKKATALMVFTYSLSCLTNGIITSFSPPPLPPPFPNPHLHTCVVGGGWEDTIFFYKNKSFICEGWGGGEKDCIFFLIIPSPRLSPPGGLICKVITKDGWTLQPIFNLRFLSIKTLKQLSASAKPEIKMDLSLFSL